MNKSPLNDWDTEIILRKDEIKEFDFLKKHNFIEEIEDDFFYLLKSSNFVEESFYKEKAEEIAREIGVENISKESKEFINKLNLYNETKDTAQTLIGKVAEFRGVCAKDIYKELNVDNEEEE